MENPREHAVVVGPGFCAESIGGRLQEPPDVSGEFVSRFRSDGRRSNVAKLVGDGEHGFALVVGDEDPPEKEEIFLGLARRLILQQDLVRVGDRAGVLHGSAERSEHRDEIELPE